MIDYLKHSFEEIIDGLELTNWQKQLWRKSEQFLDSCIAGKDYDKEQALSVFTEFYYSLPQSVQSRNIYWYKAIITYLNPIFAFSNFVAECSENAEINEDLEIDISRDQRHVTLIASNKKNIDSLKSSIEDKLTKITE
jgi:hypothetical protein